MKIEFDINKEGHFLYYASDEVKMIWEESIKEGAKAMSDELDKQVLKEILEAMEDAKTQKKEDTILLEDNFWDLI